MIKYFRCREKGLWGDDSEKWVVLEFFLPPDDHYFPVYRSMSFWKTGGFSCKISYEPTYIHARDLLCEISKDKFETMWFLCYKSEK